MDVHHVLQPHSCVKNFAPLPLLSCARFKLPVSRCVMECWYDMSCEHATADQISLSTPDKTGVCRPTLAHTHTQSSAVFTGDAIMEFWQATIRRHVFGGRLLSWAIRKRLSHRRGSPTLQRYSVCRRLQRISWGVASPWGTGLVFSGEAVADWVSGDRSWWNVFSHRACTWGACNLAVSPWHSW